jgi:hypothetical protein
MRGEVSMEGIGLVGGALGAPFDNKATRLGLLM